MFTLHIDTIGHYQCKPQPGWDVLHSSFWSTEVSTVPVLCILGATPTGQKTCVHIHGQFPFLLVPISRARADESYLQVFAACLEDAINAAASSNSTNSHHVFSISLLSRRLKTECKESQQCIKVSFYDPDIVPKAAHLLENGAVMNTLFQPWGADLPFFLQLIIDHHLHDASHLHFSAFKVRLLSKRHEDEAQPVCSVIEGDVCRSASEFASVEWRSFSDVLCVISLPQWNTPTPAATTTPGWDVDNMPSERQPVARLKPLNLELEVDVKAVDILPSHQLCGYECGEWSAIDNLLRVVAESSSTRLLCCAACRRDHPGTTQAVTTFSSCPENPLDISDEQTAAFGFDSDDDCAMDDSDCDDDHQYEEEDDDDDSDGDIPQFDGTSDEKTATKKPSRKRASAKNSKQGTGSGGSGREDSSSQGEGSNPSCSPQVQSPVMVPGGEMPFSREQGVMSPYRHHQGSFPYQGGYYRQQWGESSMAPGMTPMSPYPGYPPTSAGWGHSTPPHSAYPFMHRFPGNSFGYYPYPRHHPYSPAFRQSATPSSRQQANFSPPVSSPMSPPSFSSSAPTVQSHSSSGSQQYAAFMSPQGAGVQRQSEGSVAQQDRVFSSSSEWQYPHPAFHNWGFAQSTSGAPAHGMPWGPTQRMPTAPGQSMPSATAQNVPSAPAQNMSSVPSSSAPGQSVPSASGQSMPSASGQSMPSASGQSMPSTSGQSMPSGSALPPATVPSISSSGSALSSGSVHTSLPSVSLAHSMSGSAVPSGPAHSMPPDSALPSVTPHSMSMGSAVPAGQIQSTSSGSDVSSDTIQNVSSGSAVSGAVQNIPSRSTLLSEPAQSVSVQPAVSSENSLSVSAESTLSGLAESISLESTQSKPPELFQNTFSESSKPIPVRSEQSMSPQSVQSLSSECGQSVPSKPVENNASDTVHSVPSGPAPNTLAMSNQGVSSQEKTLHSAQAVGLESSKDVPSRSVSDASITPVSNMPLKSFEGMPSGPGEIVSSGISLDMHASVESPSSQSVGSTVSESSSVPVVSQVGEAVASSSGYIAGKPPDAAHSVPFCNTSESSPSINPASSQFAVTSVAASGSLNTSTDSPFEMSAPTSASGPLASCQNQVSGSGEEKPADSSSSSHAVSLPSSSDVSFQSSVAPSGYTHSGSCSSVSSRSPHAAPAGPYRDMASNWWGSPFPGGPRPMQNNVTSPGGQNPFRPMHGDTMAGQRPYGPGRNHFQTAGGFNQASAMLNNQTPPGQRQPSPMSTAQNPSGPAQLCGMQSAWDSTAHGQPFPVQQNTQNLTGPRYPGPAQNIHNPVGQRYPGPASSMHSHFAQRHRIPAQSMHMSAGQRQPGPVQESSYDPVEQSQNTSDSFSLDPNRRQAQVLAGPSQTQASSLPCDRSQWQDCRKAPSTLQDLLSAPDSSAAKPSAHGPSSVNFPRRAMSMDCSPSDFYTSPTRGSDSGEAVRQEFKQPQRRSGSFGSPLGFSGSGGGGGAPSALSNLFNFVSNVDPMARTPTPTSRNSTPSSTPHSDPSPNLTYRPEEDCGAVEIGLPAAKWQPHLSSPPAPPPPQGASVDEGLGGQAKPAPPVASPVLGSANTASSTPSMSREQVWDIKPQVKQQTEVSEESEVGCKVEKKANTEVLMCNKEVSCDNMDIPVQTMPCKGTKKETGRAASKGKKDSGGVAVSTSTSSAASGRVGKQNRMKKLGGNMTRGRRMSDDRVKSPPSIPFPCPAYTFTFHVPTPVYKRFKMHAIFPEKPAHHVKLVRMHPMDARRYSLLKIGRELVRLKRLSPQDLRTKRECSPASCTDDTASYTDDHNSLIDPHTGELMRPFPPVIGGVQTGLQSSRYKNGTEQSGRLLDPGHCMVPKRLAEGSCQTSPRSMNRMGRIDGEQKMHRLSPGPVGVPTSLPYNIQNDMGEGNSGQSWQTLDRDRRPSVKVEYPAQRGSNGSEQWPGGHPASQAWAGGGSWGYNSSQGPVQWGENWQNTNQPPAWGPNHGGQPYNYGPWMGGGGGFHHPGASNMYPYNTWSPSGHSFTSQPSMSTAHSQSATTGSPSTSQGSMGPVAQGQAYHQGYPHGGSGMYNQQAAFPPSSHPNNTGGKFAPHGGSGMGAEHFPYHGTPSAQNYSHGMGHNPYQANYAASGYQPAGGNRKVMCQPGFGVGQQQQQQQQSVGGMTGLPQENQQFRQCGNPASFEPGGGYSASGPAPSMPSAPPHGPGPGPGPGPGSAQFSGQSAHVPPTQQGPFMPASQQQLGPFFQPNQLSHQSGQFPSHTQASRVPPQADQAVFSPTDQQAHSGNQLCSPSETSSQDGPCQTSKTQDLSGEREKQQEQFSKTPGAQDQQENKSESDSGCPEVGDSSVGSHDLHTPEHKSFLQKAACQALTTVCEASLPIAQNFQSDRPETDISENSTDTIELNTIVQNTISRGYTQHTESKCIIFDDSIEAATLQTIEDECEMPHRKKSASKCALKGRRSSNSFKDKQQQRTAVTSCSRQNLRRSSVQLWSDGDSDSVEDNSDEESSDDYQPSSRRRRKKRKRKRSRHQSRTETKRTKRSSVNYSAHAFSKYLDHDFEKRSSQRLRQSRKSKRKRRKRKGNSLVEGVHYIVVGKFKGHRLMLVKLNKVKVKVDERIKVSDWSRSGGKSQVTTPGRLQGPRCRRIAKGTPPDDPCFVQPGDSADSDSDSDEEDCAESALEEEEEKSVNGTPACNSNNEVEPAVDVKVEDSCDVKQAIKQETHETPVHVPVNEGDVAQTQSDSFVKSEHAEDSTKGSGALTEGRSVDASSDKTDVEAAVSPQEGELGHQVECSDSGIEHEDSGETGNNTERKPCSVKTELDATSGVEASEKEEQQQGDAVETQSPGDSHIQPASCPGAEELEEDGEDTVDFSNSTCAHTDDRSCDVESALGGQSPVLLAESGEPVKTMSTAVGLSLLEGKTC